MSVRILVASCWKYRECWRPFFTLFERFWPDCPYPVTFVTDRFEAARVPFNKAEVYVMPRDSWCGVLRDTLPRFEEKCILLLQEDFLLSNPVNQNLVTLAVEEFERRQPGCLRLYPCPGGTGEIGHPQIARVPNGERYRISCQAALWRKDFLQQLVAPPNEAASDFEIGGSVQADAWTDEVLAWKREAEPWPLEYICTGIVNGEWSPGAKWICERERIEVNWSHSFAS